MSGWTQAMVDSHNKKHDCDPPSRSELQRLYCLDKLSTTDIASRYGVPNGTAYNWLVRYGIPIRPMSEGVSIAQTGVPHSARRKAAIGTGNRGKKRTPEQCANNSKAQKKLPVTPERLAVLKKCSDAKRGTPHSQEHRTKIAITHQTMEHPWLASLKGRGKGGKRPDLGVFVRSTWEANYYRLLIWMQAQNLIARFEYEPERFWFDAPRGKGKGVRSGNVSYLPDFKVYENDGSFHFVEVKGWMDSPSKTKLKRMGIYYPEYSVKIVGSKEYGVLARQFKGINQGWE